MLIKLLCGTYGAEERGIIVAKTSKSEPFCVKDERGKALIESGYAVEIKSEYPSEDHEQADPEKEQKKGDTKDDLDSYSFQELRKKASEMGLSAGGSRQDIIARIKAEETKESSVKEEPDHEDNEDDKDNKEESPLLVPADPEV